MQIKTMICSSFIFFLHIDGVNLTTKKNWFVECVGLYFLIMRADVCHPHRPIPDP